MSHIPASQPLVLASVSSTGRIQANSLPRLLSALASYRQDLYAPINMVGFGSSVGVGATLSTPYADAPLGYFTSKLAATFDSAGLFNWQAYNACVNGSAIADFSLSSHWMTLVAQLQVTAIAIANGGSGYAVGDVLTVVGGVVSSAFSLAGLPATIRVTATSSGVMTAAVIKYAGMYSSAPASPNSPTGGTGSGASFTLTTATIVPHVVAFAYGMNDGAPALYNSGQTYPGFLSSMQQAATTIHQVGADLVLVTTPHPSAVNHPTDVFNFPNSIPQNYPTVIAQPVLMTQVSPPYPNVGTQQSAIAIDLLNGGPTVTMTHRHLRVNQAMREIAADYGAAVIDAERYWFAAMQSQVIYYKTQALAEGSLFNPGEYVHPNLLGHQLSYHAAIDDFCIALAQQTQQPNYEPRLNGYKGINGGTLPAAAVLDVYPPYPDSTTKVVSLKARTGAADGAGVKANVEQWYVDPATGELVSKTVRIAADWPVAGFPPGTYLGLGEGRMTWLGNLTTGYSQRFTSYNIGAGANLDIPIPDNSGGQIRIRAFNNGVGTSQLTTAIFSARGGTLTVTNSTEIAAGTQFTIAASGLNVRIANITAATNYFIHIEVW